MTTGNGQPLLAIEDVHVYYGNIAAVKGLTMTVMPGEIVTLIGSNGAGKSTTLRTISGLLRPRQGHVTFEGKRIDRTPAEDIVRRGIAQAYGLNAEGGSTHSRHETRATESPLGRSLQVTRGIGTSLGRFASVRSDGRPACRWAGTDRRAARRYERRQTALVTGRAA